MGEGRLGFLGTRKFYNETTPKASLFRLRFWIRKFATAALGPARIAKSQDPVAQDFLVPFSIGKELPASGTALGDIGHQIFLAVPMETRL